MSAAANQGASTMHLYAISVLFKRSDGTVDFFKAAHDLSTFGYFQRSRWIYFFLIDDNNIYSL